MIQLMKSPATGANIEFKCYPPVYFGIIWKSSFTVYRHTGGAEAQMFMQNGALDEEWQVHIRFNLTNFILMLEA